MDTKRTSGERGEWLLTCERERERTKEREEGQQQKYHRVGPQGHETPLKKDTIKLEEATIFSCEVSLTCASSASSEVRLGKGQGNI